MSRNKEIKTWETGSVLFVAAWVFVILAAAFDGVFAWQFRGNFDEWEHNPMARRLATSVGIEGLLTFKAAGLVFAAAVAIACRRLRNRLAVPMTLVITAAYLLLSLHYLGSFLTDEQPAQILALATR